ncbi:MAG: biopolymer transporter ExbD [Gammaproteobacteria bacterium]|nr:biopolymer transporter ExbD [Gammaproteobacteria bacterium]MCY4165158.1 biopolymer transporter ExbD [Gammaproteobacteria bacterium]MCY4339834.1 biopolymer transporter ExbD [Gammaproteobacteria bacterium]
MIERRQRKRAVEEAEINITPMLDIVFIMLIFFIVTTSFTKELGVDLDRPSNAPVKEQKRSEVIPVRIDANGQVFIEGRLVNVGAIRANIVSALARKPGATVVVIADRNADSGYIVTVVDQARVAGAAKVSLAAAAR